MPLPLTEDRKVFCIGLNKTGTTSLHKLFTGLGLKSLHLGKWARQSHQPEGIDYLRQWTCYSDGEKPNLENISTWFPESVFILNTRDTRKWLRSRVKHVYRLEGITGFDPKAHGPMAKRFFDNPERTLDRWYATKISYESYAREFFAGHENFAELDLERDPAYADTIISALRKQKIIAPASDCAPPVHANARPEAKMPNRPLVERYFAYIDQQYERQKYTA